MKKLTYILLMLAYGCTPALAQTKIDGAYVQALYKKYPTVKSNFCPACKLWVNPYYKSIADTQRHMPLVEYEYYTKANAALSKKLNIPRQAPKKGAPVKPGQMPYQSAFSAWSPVTGQPSEDNVYSAANKVVKAKNAKDEIAKGHVQAWILNSFAVDAVILSDTYTFNAACEDQKQNVGTEIFTENQTRKLLETSDVEVWGGTYDYADTTKGNKPHSFAVMKGKVVIIKDVYPAIYWKIIKCNGQITCYWMPNLITETQAMAPKRVVTYPQLIQNLGFDPTVIFPPK
ncbi:MAG: hypothetical protein JWR50_609 [Mucilaginibacter sp.]|nr:hypothetical protein [Mucilaginibacter sp.]